MSEDMHDPLVDRVIGRMDELERSKPQSCILNIKVNGENRSVSQEEFEMRVGGDGYLRVSTPFGKHIEQILGFTEVCAAIEEEKREWWRDYDARA